MFMRRKIRQNLIRLSAVLTLGISTAYGSELVIATTLAREGVQHLIDEWHKQPDAAPVITLNRTSDSIRQLFSTERANEVDLILSSSPMLFANLQQKGCLAELPSELALYQQFVPSMLQNKVLPFSLSGYGMLINTEVLVKQQVLIPHSWQDLTRPELQGLVIISSPTRSDTNHIMLETVLQQFGWEQGWALLNQIMANVGTISSRSFGVVDKVQAGLGGVGITIDNYANLFTAKRDFRSPLIFHHFEHFTFSPTFIALNKTSSNHLQANAFIRFLLSPQGQAALNHSETGKIPIAPLPSESKNYAVQQKLFKQPQIDYRLMLKREYLVKLLFEQQITYRLNQLQENWQLLRQKEAALGKTLPELREILNRLPVSAEQAEDERYLTTFNREQRLLDWQAFFISQQLAFISALEKLQ